MWEESEAESRGVPAHDDVEGRIYERLYGSHEGPGDGEHSVLGAGDPLASLEADTVEAQPVPKRRAGTLAAATGAARDWLRRRSQRRYPVVAPPPSPARALALIALGIALLAVAALGAFVPDRPADEGLVAGGPSPPRASADDARAREAEERRAERKAVAARERRARRARARRRAAAARERRERSVTAVQVGDAVSRTSARSAPRNPASSVVCVEGGGCYAPAPSTGNAPSSDGVVYGEDVPAPVTSGDETGASTLDGSAPADEVVVESVLP